MLMLSVLLLDVGGRMRTLSLPACPLTSASSISVAAFVPGTLVNELVALKPGQQTVRIGHPSGVMTMYPYLDDPTKPLNDIVVSGVAVQRTARRIMDGTLYIRK